MTIPKPKEKVTGGLTYDRLVKELRDPRWQAIDPWRRRVISESADAIENLLVLLEDTLEALWRATNDTTGTP